MIQKDELGWVGESETTRKWRMEAAASSSSQKLGGGEKGLLFSLSRRTEAPERLPREKTFQLWLLRLSPFTNTAKLISYFHCPNVWPGSD